MKKLILLTIIMLILTGCSGVDEETYNELLNKYNQNKETLEEYSDQVEEYEEDLEQANSVIDTLKEILEDAKGEINALKEENQRLKNNEYSEDFYTEHYKKHFEPVLTPEEARAIIEDRSQEAIRLLSEYDFEGLANMIHPMYGVRFTPYTHVEIDRDLVFSKDDVKSFDTDKSLYIWGVYDGIGDSIELKPLDYFKKFVYDVDFANAEKTSYNEIITQTGWIENQFAMYHNSIIVEYYFSGFNPDHVGMDWRSLRIVFQRHDDKWYITGIIHNEWTI